jgi:heat shock protein HslJ
MRVEHTNGSLEYRTLTITVNPKTTAGTSWIVSSLYGNQVPIPGTTMTAYFGDNGSFSANGGCNTFQGGYTENNGAVAIGPLAGTQMSCGQSVDTQEQTYLAALAAARTFVIRQSQLILFDSGVQEVVRFNFVQ